MLKKSLLIITMFIGTALFSSNLDKLNRAVEKIKYENDLFQYNSTVIEEADGEKSVVEISFNPLRDPKHVLISVDGKKPTDKDKEEFYKEIEQEEEDEEGSFDELLGDEYKLVSNKNGIATYSYTTTESIVPDKDFFMDGIIKIDLDNEEVISIALKNPKDFKMMGAKLSVMEMDFIFESYDNDYRVVKEMNFNVNGNFLFKKFSEKSNTKIYDYKMVN